MTDRKKALQDLLAKVEAGSGIEYAAYRAAFPHPKDREHEPCKNMDRARMTFIGSLDAAKALHEAALPRWTMDQMNEWHENGRSKGWAVHLLRNDDPKMRKSGSGFGISPARAWLIAILKALIAQEGET